MRLPFLAADAAVVLAGMPAPAPAATPVALQRLSSAMNDHLPGRYGPEMAVLRTRVDAGLLYADVAVSDRIATFWSRNEGWSPDIDRLACSRDSVFRDVIEHGVTVAFVLWKPDSGWAGEVHYGPESCH
jgi:hypothetical protein